MPSIKNIKSQNINQLAEELSREDPFNESILSEYFESPQIKNSEQIHKTVIPNQTHEIPINHKAKQTQKETPVEHIRKIEHPKNSKKTHKPKKNVEKLNPNEYMDNFYNMNRPKEENNYYTNYDNMDRTMEPEDTDNYYNMNKPLRNSCYGQMPRTRRNQREMNYDNNYDNFFGDNFFDFGGLNKTFRGMNNNIFDNFFF